MAKNELVEITLKELARFGIKGEERPRGKHTSVVWVLPNGQEQFAIIAVSASDHRSRMNARSVVRRMLKGAGLNPVPLEKVTSFRRAISLPDPNIITDRERLARTEADIEVLTDLMFELHERLTQGVTATVDINFEARQVPAYTRPVFEGIRVGSVQEQVLSQLNNVPLKTREIAARFEWPVVKVANTMNELRKKQLVKRHANGGWTLTENAQALVRQIEVQQA